MSGTYEYSAANIELQSHFHRIGSPSTMQHSVALLALIRDQRAINLAELANPSAPTAALSSHITEAACRELGWPWLSVEEAIVLLGGQRLCCSCSPPPPWSSASQLHRPHSNSTCDNLRPLGNFQEVPE